MSDLAEFLLERIAEDEAVAHAVAASPIETPGGYWETSNSDYAEITLAVDPARVLAECEARKAIVGECTAAADVAASIRDTFAGDDSPRARTERVASQTAERVWSDALRLLALPYADHPDYRQEWRP